MEKTSKMITAAVVLVLCAVAVIGVGYAYTAQTINSGNTAISEYIVLSQTGDGAYTFTDENTTVVWDTVNKKVGETVTTTWKMSSAIEPVTTSDTSKQYHIMQVGKDIILNATQTGGAVKSKLTCEVTTDIEYVDNIAVMLKIVNNSITTWMKLANDGKFKTFDAGAWGGVSTFEIAGGTAYANTTVSVYYGYVGDTVPTSTDEPGNAINDATLTFTASTPTA